PVFPATGRLRRRAYLAVPEATTPLRRLAMRNASCGDMASCSAATWRSSSLPWASSTRRTVNGTTEIPPLAKVPNPEANSRGLAEGSRGQADGVLVRGSLQEPPILAVEIIRHGAVVHQGGRRLAAGQSRGPDEGLEGGAGLALGLGRAVEVRVPAADHGAHGP